MAYIFLKSEFRGCKGTRVLIIKENTVEAISVQLTRGDREIKIVEGETISIRDNQGLDLGPFDTISSVVAGLDRLFARECLS